MRFDEGVLRDAPSIAKAHAPLHDREEIQGCYRRTTLEAWLKVTPDGMVILYIDDDQDDIEFLFDAATKVDQQSVCISAHNGEQGLTLLRNVIPDIILLDVNMPVMNGRETLMMIRQDDRLKNTPVVMLSTTSNNEEINAYTEMGATAFFTKPTSLQGLYSLIRNIFQTVTV